MSILRNGHFSRDMLLFFRGVNMMIVLKCMFFFVFLGGRGGLWEQLLERKGFGDCFPFSASSIQVQKRHVLF